MVERPGQRHDPPPADAAVGGLEPCDAAVRGGVRILPPVSVPMAPSTKPAARATPLPLLDPPGTCSGFQGLRAGLSRCPGGCRPKANSCVLSLPSMTAPAAR